MAVKSTTLHYDDELQRRKDETGLTWNELLLLGIETALLRKEMEVKAPGRVS